MTIFEQIYKGQLMITMIINIKFDPQAGNLDIHMGTMDFNTAIIVNKDKNINVEKIYADTIFEIIHKKETKQLIIDKIKKEQKNI
jgi:hypothetical protein